MFQWFLGRDCDSSEMFHPTSVSFLFPPLPTATPAPSHSISHNGRVNIVKSAVIPASSVIRAFFYFVYSHSSSSLANCNRPLLLLLPANPFFVQLITRLMKRLRIQILRPAPCAC